MIVQLIGTKYVKICEAVWAESRTHHPYSGRTNGHTDMNPMSPVRGIRPAGDNKMFPSPHTVISAVVLANLIDLI